jgi:hypothetical protein
LVKTLGATAGVDTVSMGRTNAGGAGFATYRPAICPISGKNDETGLR